MTESTAPKHRLKAWVVLLAVLCLVATWFFWQLLMWGTPIKVSRETTYITEPLRDDGLPDYPRYLLEQGREGVTPENNAAVLYLQALWPAELPPELHLPMCAALGLDDVPNPRSLFTEPDSQAVIDDLIEWVKTSGRFDQKTVESLDEDGWNSWGWDATDVWHQPWKREQYPPRPPGSNGRRRSSTLSSQEASGPSSTGPRRRSKSGPPKA